MNLNKTYNVFFIGIGGIGMSALARYLLHVGKHIAGYDRTPSQITEDLSGLQIKIQFEDNIEQIPETFFNKEGTLIVYTPAIKRNENKILDYFIDQKFTVIKRAELLGIITQKSICLAVAGTHGKTTTSSILGHILKETNTNASSFLGGVAENYNSNLIIGGDKYAVVEADEFDRSFLHLHPDYACITSIDADHLDIYEDKKELKKAFKEFAALPTKKLLVKKGIPIEGITYGIDEDSDYDAQNIRIENGTYVFTIKTPTETYKNLKTNLPGKHNVLNTVAALAMANIIGVSLHDIAKALLSYKGVQRRFSYRIHSDNLILIDDYAHHPTEISAVYKAIREMYPKEQVLVVFQPHLYSRTRDFMSDFVKSLALYDEILLLPIYPAREKPIAGVSSKVMLDEIKKINYRARLIAPEEITSKIEKSISRIVMMLGAGDIGEMVKDVKEKLEYLAV